MDKIYNIKYVDAYYTYAKDSTETHLPLHEAYGYVERNGGNVVIIFIKKRSTDIKRSMDKKEPIVEGLIIPDAALIPVVETSTIDIVKNIALGTPVAVVWRDMIHVANMSIYECSVMHSKGVLYRIEKDHIVLKEPETIRTYPTHIKIKNHPMIDKPPTYVMIPTSFITDITITK